jgi:hypothetical protein
MRVKGAPSAPSEANAHRSVPSATSPARTIELSCTSIRAPIAISWRRIGLISSLPLIAVASGGEETGADQGGGEDAPVFEAEGGAGEREGDRGEIAWRRAAGR